MFAPIRTETFKLQLKAFEELLAFFENKSQTDFFNFLDLHRIASLNTLQMADRYVSHFFTMKIDKEKRAAELKPLIGAIVSKEHFEQFFEVIDAQPSAGKTDLKDNGPMHPAILLAHWQKHEHGMIGYTQEYLDRTKELERLAASPLLPKGLRAHISEFRDIYDENLSLIGKAITACGQQMPEHFPTASHMKDFNTSWVWNRFNHDAKSFEPVASKILNYVNTYLKVEDIMA